MAAKTINVNYNRNQTPPVTFAPDNGNVTITESSTITFKADPNFTYTNFWTTPANPDFGFTIAPNGDMVVTDDDADAGTYEYTISIAVNGTSFDSDPQIINRK